MAPFNNPGAGSSILHAIARIGRQVGGALLIVALLPVYLAVGIWIVWSERRERSRAAARKSGQRKSRKTLIFTLFVSASAFYFVEMYRLSVGYNPTALSYAVPGIPNSEIIPRPFAPVEGHAVRGVDFYFKDDAEKKDSPVMLYEDGRPLGPAHSYYSEITRLGMGRFAHAMGSSSVFIFSSSDNTDPNTNGRRYWAVREPRT